MAAREYELSMMKGKSSGVSPVVVSIDLENRNWISVKKRLEEVFGQTFELFQIRICPQFADRWVV
ncbi:MAG: hypothetical protein QM757_12475 [Paludibaculum sp.]